MKKMWFAVLVAPIFLAQIQTPGWGGQNANISGKVFDSQGNPVSGVEILAADVNGQPRGHSLTNEQGEYVVTGLEKGKYQLTLNPRSSGLKGQTVVAALDQRGLEVAWTASTAAPAIATANTPLNDKLRSAPSATANKETSVEPLLAASTVAGSPAAVPVGPSIQAVTAATMAGDTAGAVANTGQGEDSSRRRRGFFLGGLGLVGAGLGGAAADGAFDDDNDKDNVVSDSQ